MARAHRSVRAHLERLTAYTTRRRWGPRARPPPFDCVDRTGGSVRWLIRVSPPSSSRPPSRISSLIATRCAMARSGLSESPNVFHLPAVDALLRHSVLAGQCGHSCARCVLFENAQYLRLTDRRTFSLSWRKLDTNFRSPHCSAVQAMACGPRRTSTKVPFWS